MSRNARHAKILEIIAKKEIETQEELVAELRDAGFDVTQATVSRDIKDLGLLKAAGSRGRQKYVRGGAEAGTSGRVVDMFRNSVVSIASALNIIVIKTLPGSANVAGHMLDSLNNADILGCVAGDDTVFVVVQTEAAADELTVWLKDAAHL